MPTYFPNRIEPKWQKYWLENKTFRAEDFSNKPKYYILDMFPYPSAAGLHVGHPEGYTATDILARYKRMRGFNVLHPMGWDSFGLPAEQHAIDTNTHPRVNTEQNINTFRRQIQALGFSYDWDREVATTDVDYYKWTQWIFLKLFDTWFDPVIRKGRPIAELPIPEQVTKQGEAAIAEYKDSKRLAYITQAPVNWCPALGTVLANEEVIDGKSERGNHPVVRLPMKQWMLRITSYAQRLLEDLDQLDWSDHLKEMQRNWIGRSEGAEVDFPVFGPSDTEDSIEEWFDSRKSGGYPTAPTPMTVRIFTTRPDTLFGATYMVLAPEHPLVDQLTTPDHKDEVTAYREQASRKSDLDRTDLAKQKTGVFTGSYATNPVNREQIPIWVADYVLMGYGTGAIMAVPAHDERDFEFAKKFELNVVEVLADLEETPSAMQQIHQMLGNWERKVEDTDDERFLKAVLLLNCGFDLESFEQDMGEFAADPMWEGVTVSQDDEAKGIVVTFLDDDFGDTLMEYVDEADDTEIFLFSLGAEEPEYPDYEDPEANGEGHICDATCEHDHEDAKPFCGEGIAIYSGIITGLPTAEAKQAIIAWLDSNGVGKRTINFKIRDWLFSRQRYWGEPFPILLDEQGMPTAIDESELPVDLPEVSDFRPTGTPDPPLSKATDWLTVERNGKKYRREVNTMPQWAGSCWYYLRYLDPKNTSAGWSTEKENYWMPVDLYVGGAEHAVLHLLYARFWHKVLYDLGFVHTVEPFMKLVNQGMILGEMEYTGYKADGKWTSFSEVVEDEAGAQIQKSTKLPVEPVKLAMDCVDKDGDKWVLLENPKIRVDARAYKMSKSRGNVINPDKVVEEYGADSLRMYEMFMGPLEATKPWNMKGVEGIWRFLNRVWRLFVDEQAEGDATLIASATGEATREQLVALHKTIKGVTEDIDAMRFNTAISKLMEYTNFLTPLPQRPGALLEPLVVMLSPFAPHVAEELWSALGHTKTLAYEPWPVFEAAMTEDENVEVVLQVNSKVKSKLVAPTNAPDDVLIAMAAKDEKILAAIAGKEVLKSFVVSSRKGKLVNFVLK